jgi:hypothetical protein
VTLVETVVALALCLVLVAGLAAWTLVVAHQRRVLSMVGSLPLALKRDGARWSNGVGRYAGEELLWYRTLSLTPIADERLPRAELAVVSRRPWDASRDMALRPNHTILECRLRDATVTLGFPDNAANGFQSWLEASSPPSGD